MTYDFNQAVNYSIPNLNDGDGTVFAKVIPSETGSVMFAVIPPGCSIGPHTHDTDMDFNFIVSGTGIAVCDGEVEALSPGICHFCPRGSRHSIRNTGNTDMQIYISVVRT